MNDLGETLWRLRERAGLSQEALAEKLGVTRQTVSNWENGRATPDAHKLAKLCEVLGVGADELLGLPARPSAPKRKWLIAAAAALLLAAVAAVLLAVFSGGGEMTSTVILTPAFLWSALAAVAAVCGAVCDVLFFRKK